MKFSSIRDIPQQTFINAANRKSTNPLPQILIIHFYLNSHTYRFRLVIILQRFVIPDNIGIDRIFRPWFSQHKLRYGTGKERSFSNFNTHPAIRLPRTNPDRNAGFRITHI